MNVIEERCTVGGVEIKIRQKPGAENDGCVCIGVVEAHVDEDTGVDVHELRNGRRLVQDAERHRGADPERPARLALQDGNLHFRVDDRFQALPTAFVEDSADFGEIQASRRPDQQARAKTVFQSRDVLADHRLRQVQPLGGGGERPALYDANEDGDVAQTAYLVAISQHT